MVALAERLYEQRVHRDVWGADDVLAYWGSDGRAVIGFRGDALRLEGRLRLEGWNRDHHLDVAIQRAAGLDARPWMQGWRAVGVEGGAGQTMTDGTFAGDVADGMGTIVSAALPYGDDRARIALLPREGAPWNPGDEATPYYSAKARGLLYGEPPPGARVASVHTTMGEQELWVADFCAVALRLEGSCQTGALVGRVGPDGDPFLVAHSLTLDRQGRGSDADIAAAIARCGGLLFPSLSVGPVPASNFGECSLVADVGILLAGLKPYRGRVRWPIRAYTSDVWTPTTGTLLGTTAAELFAQVSGAWAPSMVGPAHMLVLGPEVEDGTVGFGGAEARPVESTRALATAVKRRARHWPRGITQARIDAANERGITEAAYPYLEAKCNGVLPLGCMPLAVVPADQADRYERFLRAAGFAGDVLVIQAPAHIVRVVREHDVLESALWYEYGWLVREAVEEYAVARGWVFTAQG